MDIFRLYNKSYNYYIASQEKTTNFFGTSQKKIGYFFPKQNHDIPTFVTYIEDYSNENLSLYLEVKKKSVDNSILTLFEIIKCD